MTVASAVEQLLAGTGLVARADQSGAFIVTVAARPVAARDVAVAAPPERKAAEELDKVVIIGSRRTDRTVTDSAAPVDVFTAATLETQPSEDTNEILRNLVPSFNVDRWAVNDGSTFIRPPTMRGLPAGQVLVMVNGKRRHRAAIVHYANGVQGVDMAMIPGVAVERLEVLRDGASAQYGSDAIAGVFNYVLKSRTDGVQLRARYGQYYEGDGQNTQIATNVGLPLGDDGFFDVSAEWAQTEQTSRGAQLPGAYILSTTNPTNYGAIRNPGQIWGNPESESIRTFFNSGIDISDDMRIYAFGNYAESDQEYDFNYRQPINVTGPDKFGNGNSTVYGQAGSIFANLYTQTIPGLRDAYGNPVFDGTGPTYNLRSLYPLGFTPRFFGHINDLSLVSGFSGERDNFTWDISAAFGRNQIEYRLKNTLNPSLGPDTPTDFYLGMLEQRETNFNADFTYELEAGLASPITFAFGGEHRKEAYAIYAGEPASYENGIYGFQTVRRADGTTFRNSAQGIGSNGFQGLSPDNAVDRSRRNYAVYGSAEADIIENLSVGAALRYEKFSDFGDTTNWKVSARYQPLPWLAFRGTANTAFSAPTPGQTYQTNISYSWVGQDPLESAIYPVENVAAKAFGAVPLKPEKAKALSGGVIFMPSEDISLAIDAFRIDIDDRLGLTGFFDINTPARRQILRDVGLANAETLYRLRYFTNAYSTRNEGVDIVASWRADTDVGVFNTTLAANYTQSQVTDTVAHTVLGQPYYVINPTVVGNVTEGSPKWRGYLTENWSHGPFAVMARATFYDGWSVYDVPANGGTRSFHGAVTVDMEMSYRVNEGIQVALGASNLLDKYPDKDINAEGGGQNYFSFTGGLNNGRVYPENSPFGYNGGFVYARLNLDF
ncbi:MAG TPA: TonB-dependent receptor [Hyphomonadaceae bacterium]|nr:TonB-dependent receptor [Hyphomonadaceae bacterium]HPN04292.1 TonB-dependent receptor [Hyphomonadaceae bacterium]